MLEKKLESLTESLKIAKEANDLTVSNIFTIVGEATTKIVKELEFDHAMTKDVAKDVLDTAISTLDELGDLTAENIKASNEGAMDAVEKVIKEDSVKIVEEFKTFGDLALDVLKQTAEGAMRGAREALDKREK